MVISSVINVIMILIYFLFGASYLKSISLDKCLVFVFFFGLMRLNGDRNCQVTIMTKNIVKSIIVVCRTLALKYTSTA